MARSHAKIHADIWQDDEFVALTGDAQRLYFVILGQPKLNLAGTLDLKLERWSTFCADWTSDRTAAALTELEATRYVLVDHTTEEVTVRTFVKNDVVSGRWNVNTAKGVWSAWKSIESRHLKAEIVHAMPDDVWHEKLAEYAPDQALRIRDTPVETVGSDGLIEPTDTEPTDQTNRSNGQPEPPSPSPSPSPSPQPQPPDGPDQPPDPDPPAAAADPGTVIDQALALLVERTIARKPAHSNPAGYRRSLEAGKRTDHLDAAHDWLERDPDLTPEDLAEILEPPAWPNHSTQPTPPRPATPRPHCDTCSSSGIVTVEGGAARCPDCTSSTEDLIRAAIHGDHQ